MKPTMQPVPPTSPASMPLLASPAFLDQPAVWSGGAAWTWREIHTAAVRLAAQLTGAATVCNLCTSRVGFLITWLAALRGGLPQTLPPSSGSTDLAAVLAMADAPVTIVLDDGAEAHLHRSPRTRCLVLVPDRTPAAPSDTVSDAELAWSPAWDQPLVRLYTSGSTGTPEAHSRTLRQLVSGAQALAARLALDIPTALPAATPIVCSVAPQHMFGLETSVMLPLLSGLSVLEGRPLLPADIDAALQSCPAGAILVATPLHLGALARLQTRTPHCLAVIASTMPLTAEVASQAEACCRAPVLEIYGSTETGVIAMRRTALHTAWSPVQGVTLAAMDNGFQVWGAHFPSPCQMGDTIQAGDGGQFTLLGRQSDVLKIGGRRASLAGLNQLLTTLPTPIDGAFYLPSTGLPTERLVLIHTGPALDRAATDACLRERMDAVFLPRATIRVPQLPRSHAGKLPRAALDRIYADWLAAKAESAGMRCEFTVASDHPALAGHFPGRPVVPGVLLLDHVMSAVQRLTGLATARIDHVKFIAVLLPNEAAQLQFELTGMRATFKLRTRRLDANVDLAQGALALISAAKSAGA